MSKDKIKTIIQRPLSKFKDIIYPFPMFPQLGQHITNAENPTETREMILDELPKDEFWIWLRKNDGV